MTFSEQPPKEMKALALRMVMSGDASELAVLVTRVDIPPEDEEKTITMFAIQKGYPLVAFKSIYRSNCKKGSGVSFNRCAD